MALGVRGAYTRAQLFAQRKAVRRAAAAAVIAAAAAAALALRRRWRRDR